jgi:hypothetical protein
MLPQSRTSWDCFSSVQPRQSSAERLEAQELGLQLSTTAALVFQMLKASVNHELLPRQILLLFQSMCLDAST